MKEWIAVLRAADTARWHVHQRRKGIAQEPYMNHLLEVASLVSEATSGSGATAVIAALLHDAVEDQEVPVEMIAREFGKQVADIVIEVTDDKTLPKDERKRKQIETAPKKSREAKLIKLADKTSNLRAVASRVRDQWSRSGSRRLKPHVARQGRLSSSSSGAAFAKRAPAGTIADARSMRCRAPRRCPEGSRRKLGPLTVRLLRSDRRCPSSFALAG
jgi:(p)ppGpp synthase/HD superfamily hydrolase